VDATQGLSSVRANMERYYQDNRSYTTGPTAPPCTATAVQVGNFNISCPPIDATHFTASAVGIAGTNAAGFTFTVTESDVQTTVVAPPAPSAFLGCATAWVTKTGGC
jgi:type IV pilus assembly protein PilE